MNITIQNIQLAQNEIKVRKGAYLPFMNAGIGTGIDKSARYTRNGALDATTNIDGQNKIPTLLPNVGLYANFSWQVDIWKKLRNAKQSAVYRYLASIEGKNFMVTQLVAEVAHNYYELMAFDNLVDIIQKNIEIQENALRIVNLEKTAGQVTELAVRRFQAEVSKNKSYKFFIQQKIIESENRINFLLGRFPQPIIRNSNLFNDLKPENMLVGIPSQLLENRPDIRQATLAVQSANLDIKVAKANFYPNFNISAVVGYEAFNPKYFINLPESLLFGLVGGLVAPVINRNAIKADYLSANNRQIQSVYGYERTVLNAFIEVFNQSNNIKNLASLYEWKVQQVTSLSRSVEIVINLFKSARADYVEILLTQRDALESKIDLVEIKKQQLSAMINMYQALGGGWR